MLIKLTNNKHEFVVDHNDILLAFYSVKCDRTIIHLKSDRKEERTGWFVDQTPSEVMDLVKNVNCDLGLLGLQQDVHEYVTIDDFNKTMINIFNRISGNG